MPKLPLPSGLIGEAEPVSFDYPAGRPFFPFLSLTQLVLLLATYTAVVGTIALVAPNAMWHFLVPFVAVGSALGALPSILMTAPCRLRVRTPRPEPWADFTRDWAKASRYRRQDGNPDIWLPDMPIWIRWPGDSMRLRITPEGLEVTGRRLMMRQLKRNYDRITERGYGAI